MNKTVPKRGRPPKATERSKAVNLDICLLAIEKQAFRDAADLAGLDLSAWVKERLRMLARKELEAAGQPVAFLGEAPLDHVTEARYVRPAQLYLHFADGLEGTWPFADLDLDMANMKVTTIKASKAGTCIEVQSRSGENVEIDSPSLRYLVDKKYAAKIDKSIRDLHITPAEFDRAAAVPLDPRWYDVGDEDDLL